MEIRFLAILWLIPAFGQNVPSFEVADVKATAQAIFDATSRFHHPAHSDDWRDPQLAARIDAVLSLLIKGLETPHKR